MDLSFLVYCFGDWIVDRLQNTTELLWLGSSFFGGLGNF